MDLRISGLRAIVTAGAGGIGRTITMALAAEGARVHVCDVDRHALDEIKAVTPGVTTSICDVSDRAAVAALFEEAVGALGGLDCLVNNAGIAGPTGRVDAIAPEAWDRTLAVNVSGQFNCVRLAVPHLAKSSNASIVNISSAAGRFGFGLRTPYAASKWAIIGLTKSLSIELGELGIRVNAVLPGLVDGERQTRVLAAKAEARGISLNAMKGIALANASIKQFISPQELADAILLLVSPRGRTTSGQAISVDGDLQTLA
jgi:NAD(P)-dependent dehydrogenase (short-subunit alcohol dehydrogenase family)